MPETALVDPGIVIRRALFFLLVVVDLLLNLLSAWLRELNSSSALICGGLCLGS